MAVTGVWRSLVARSAGGREVASSNLATPMETEIPESRCSAFRYFLSSWQDGSRTSVNTSIWKRMPDRPASFFLGFADPLF